MWTGEDAFGKSSDVTIRFDYLQLGFQYKILFGSDGATQVYLAPGVGLGALVNSDAESESQSSALKNVSSMDVEIGFGLGTQIPAGNNAFHVEGGYGYGLLDTVDKSNQFSANNSVIKLRVGFMLGN